MLRSTIAIVLTLASSFVWADSTTSLTTGFDYSTGKYGGTTNTNILYIPVTAKYQTDDYYLKLTVPYISISSVGTVVRGLGPVRTSTSNKVITQSGLGDVIASAGYTVFYNDDFLLDLVGNIKFGTADTNKNLGTGQNDYSAQLDGFYTQEKTTFFTTVGYKIVGAPAGVEVRNIAYGSFGLSQKFAYDISAGAALDAAESSNNLSQGARELSIFISKKLNKKYKVQTSVMKGYSDSSPDFGGSVMLTGKLD